MPKKKIFQKFQNYFDTVTKSVHGENVKLKDEIRRQQELETSLISQIEACRIKKVVLVKDLKRETDLRRNVMNLKQQMTCTPEMDIV